MPARCCPPSFFSGFLDGFIDFSVVFIDGFHLLRRFSLLFHRLHVFSIHSFLSTVSMVFIKG